MKRILSLILIMCIASACVVLPAAAVSENAETLVTAEVPDYHKITVSVEGSGTVIYNGVQVDEYFSAERLSRPKIEIRVENGYAIKKVYLNNKDITSNIVDGFYTFEPVYEDKTLNIITEYIGQPSEQPNVSEISAESSSGGVVITGDSIIPLMMFLLMALISAVTILLVSKSGKRKNNKN